MPRLALAMLLALSLAACTLDAGVEGRPTPDPALATRVRELEAAVAAQATSIARLEAAAPTATAAPAAELGQLAFVRGGDIWVMALPDGEARRLTNDGRNSQPQWSPSGGWLSFRKDGGLWLIRSDGSGGRPIGDAGEAAWSPTDDRLAYVPWERWGVFLVGPEALANTDPSGDGSLVYAEELPEGEYLSIRAPLWRPDGQALAFGLSSWRSEEGGDAVTASGLWQVDLGGEATQLVGLDDPAAALLPAAWSGDGASLLFWRDVGYDDDLADDAPGLLLASGETVELPAPLLADPAQVSAAPGGGLLALTLGPGSSTWEQKRIELLNPADGELWPVTGDETVALTPAFAPTGDSLAYVAMPVYSDLLERRLWVREGEALPRQLTGDALYRDEAPHWSADGGQILFARMTRDGRVSLWLIAAAGGLPRRLVDELTPAPDWFANDGRIDWDELFDWWQGAP